MKAVLISIRQEWCSKIARGEKTIEIRKTCPNLATPFKCYIYCTKSQKYGRIEEMDKAFGGGMVIGEFTCKRIDSCTVNKNVPNHYLEGLIRRSGLTAEEFRTYAKENGEFLDWWSWRISDLKIYDEYKEISNFRKPCVNDLYCEECGMYSQNTGTCGNAALRLMKAPQSWCYVEENS